MYHPVATPNEPTMCKKPSPVEKVWMMRHYLEEREKPRGRKVPEVR